MTLRRAANAVLKPLGLRLRARRDAYDGAQHNRTTADWRAWIMSPVQEQRFALHTLRARARDLCRNNPHARRFVNAITENVLGPNGIMLRATNLLADGTRDTARNAKVEAAWRNWNRRGNATLDGRLGGIAAASVALQAIVCDGEVFVRKIPFADNPHGFAVQLIDADYVDEFYNVPAGPGQNAIQMGIEVDALGRVVAYHVWTRHPFDPSMGATKERIRIPAAEIEHLGIMRRPGQLRYESWFAPIMVPARHLGGYVEAEIIAARTASAKMGFIIPGDGDTGEDPEENPEEEKYFEAAPGIIERLKQGDTFAEWDPQHPSANFGPFLLAMLRMQAAGLNIGQTTLTADFSGFNYSSHRGEKLMERDGFRVLQRWFAEEWCDPLFAAWLPMARLAGALTVSGATSQSAAHTWRFRGWDWVDPLKDMEANAKELALRLTSRQRLCAEVGVDFEEILAELKEEADLAESYGVSLPDPAPALSSSSPTVGVTDETGGDAGDAGDGTGANGDGGSAAPGKKRFALVRGRVAAP